MDTYKFPSSCACYVVPGSFSAENNEIFNNHLARFRMLNFTTHLPTENVTTVEPETSSEFRHKSMKFDILTEEVNTTTEPPSMNAKGGTIEPYQSSEPSYQPPEPSYQPAKPSYQSTESPEPSYQPTEPSYQSTESPEPSYQPTESSYQTTDSTEFPAMLSAVWKAAKKALG